MLELTRCDCHPLCHGHRWTIRNERRLALVVAVLLLGDHARAEILLDGETPQPPVPRTRAVAAAISVLTIEPGRDEARWHRDGLLFQMISWVAATHAAAGRRTMIRAPHVRPADKGLDGFLLDPPDDVCPAWRATICEDKATDNPRKTIREKVWPEFAAFESGARDSDVNADALPLLRAAGLSDEEVVAVTDDLWREPPRYRVSVTIDPGKPAHLDTAALFAGYDGVVLGDCDRRQADALPVEGKMRDWLDAFAGQVIDVLRAYDAGSSHQTAPSNAVPARETSDV